MRESMERGVRAGPPGRRGPPGRGWSSRWRRSARSGEDRDGSRKRGWALAALLIGGAAALLFIPPVWPTTVVLVVENRATEPVLADARWWRGATGPDGVVAKRVEPSGVDTLHVVHRAEFCVRAVDPRTHAVSSLLLDARQADAGGATRLVVSGDGGLEGGAGAERRPCPDALAAGPVRVEPGRFFVPGSPEGVQRERLLQRY